MQVVGQFPGLVHYVRDQLVYASRGAEIFRSEDGGSSWQRLARLPIPVGDQLKSFARPLRRLFRSGVYHLLPAPEKRLLVLGFGRVFVVELKLGTVHSTEPIVGSRPLSLCRHRDGFFYGEYRGNSERSPVHIWGSFDSGFSWRPVFQFDGVRHIHGVFHDPFSGEAWITTGDLDQESAIWRTRDSFENIEKVLSGSQQTRAVTLLFDSDYIYFGSDTPLEQNHLYRWHRGSERLETLATVDASVFYGCRTDRDYFFSTACEPSRVNSQDRCDVWWGRHEVWQRLASFKKDPYPSKLFQYGQVLFPAGPGESGYVWLTPFAAHPDQLSQKVMLEGRQE